MLASSPFSELVFLFEMFNWKHFLATCRELKIGSERKLVKTKAHRMGQLDIHTSAVIFEAPLIRQKQWQVAKLQRKMSPMCLLLRCKSVSILEI